MKPETWKDIPGHDYYQASDQGRIRSLPRTQVDSIGRTTHRKGRLIKPTIRSGHPGVLLAADGAISTVTVARLVARAFLGEPPAHLKNPRVVHRDGDPKNNHLDNLRWGTHSETIGQ